MTITPRERNRVRHLRDLLDAFERRPSGVLASTIEIEARELSDAFAVASVERQKAQDVAAHEALKRFGEAR